VTGGLFHGQSIPNTAKTVRHIEMPDKLDAVAGSAQQAGGCGLRDAPMLFAS